MIVAYRSPRNAEFVKAGRVGDAASPTATPSRDAVTGPASGIWEGGGTGAPGRRRETSRQSRRVTNGVLRGPLASLGIISATNQPIGRGTWRAGRDSTETRAGPELCNDVPGTKSVANRESRRQKRSGEPQTGHSHERHHHPRDPDHQHNLRRIDIDWRLSSRVGQVHVDGRGDRLIAGVVQVDPVFGERDLHAL